MSRSPPCSGFPRRPNWDAAIARFRESGSDRSPQNNFGGFIAPFRPIVTLDNMLEVFEVVRMNAQVSNASRIPEMLAAFVGAVADRYPLTLEHLIETLVLLGNRAVAIFSRRCSTSFAQSAWSPPAVEDEKE